MPLKVATIGPCSALSKHQNSLSTLRGVNLIINEQATLQRDNAKRYGICNLFNIKCGVNLVIRMSKKNGFNKGKQSKIGRDVHWVQHKGVTPIVIIYE